VNGNGIEIYYERHGTGPRLLFFNGSGATIAQGGMLFAPYVEHFDVLVADQRGLGRTEIPSGPYEMADYAADAAALLDAVGWDRCRVVGTSFGGMVAQELAVTWPERVERLALVCTSPGGAFASAPLPDSTAPSADEDATNDVTIYDTRFSPEWLAGHDDDRALAERLRQRRAAPTSGEIRRGQLEQFEARNRHDCVDRLGAVTCPTFVASGRYDGIAPPANGAVIADRVQHGELHLYEGGHIFFAQDPTAVPDVIEFLLGAARGVG
jgi:pimeloyl-ACP methyl ester carboxylesterase